MDLFQQCLQLRASLTAVYINNSLVVPWQKDFVKLDTYKFIGCICSTFYICFTFFAAFEKMQKKCFPASPFQ